MKFHSTFLLSLFLVSFFWVNAQTGKNTFSTAGWWGEPEPKFSPVVNPDQSITFRIKAPNAQKVELLFGEWFVTPQPLTKNDEGIWSLTISSVKPEIYGYSYVVDGVKTLDMRNPEAKIGTEVYSSAVEVSGVDKPRFDEVQNVPHGASVYHTFHSKTFNQTRGFTLFLPSNYFENPKEKFPVLYLRHGGGDNEKSWLADGRAGVILENLLAQQKAKPMIIVMSNGFTNGTWASGSTKEGISALANELIDEIIPFVEENYRIKTGKQNRAIAGLSMGGGQAFVIGLNNLDKFGWVGQFSSGMLASVEFDINDRIPGFDTKIDRINQLELLYLACGEDDPRYQGHLDLIKSFQGKGIKYKFDHMPGGHEWKVWRHELRNFMQLIF